MFTAPKTDATLSPAPPMAGVRRELFANDDWRLLMGPVRCWQIELGCGDRDPSEIWAEIEQTLSLLAKADCVRPLVIDLRGRPRLDPASRWGMSALLERHEAAETHVAIICDVDLVQLARVHSLLGHTAPSYGKRTLSMAEALTWVLPAEPASRERGVRPAA